jgi:hypothetical protein
MPMGGGIMYEDYNFPMMNGGMMENRIKRLENREANLVARGNKAVDEGRERKADRLLGRAARVENRLIKAKESVPVKNMIDISNVEWAPNPLFYNPMMNGGEYGYMTYNPENQAPELPEMEQMREGGIPSRYKNMGFNKVGVKKKSTRPGKKWMVLAKKDDKYKVVHGGYKGMKDFTQHRNENRRDRFWDRMGGRNSAKATDPFSPLYWHKRFRTWAEGGEPQNAGFQALPQEVQAKIMANMMYGGDMYQLGGIFDSLKGVRDLVLGDTPEERTQTKKLALKALPMFLKDGGMPCYECGGQMKYKKGGIPFTAMAYFGDGGMPYYQGGGFVPMPQMVMDEILTNAEIAARADGNYDVDNVADNAAYEAAKGELDKYGTLWNSKPKNTQMGPMLPGQQLSSDFSKFWETNNPFDKKDIAYMTQNKRGQPMDEDMYRLKKGAREITGAVVDKGKDYLKDRYADYSTFGKGFKSATNTVGDLVSLGSWFGRNKKERQAAREIQRRTFTDNLYEAAPMGVTGQRGDYDIMGNFRPDETLASRTYMGEAYAQMGGEIEMTEDQIRQLVALGAEIEILD